MSVWSRLNMVTKADKPPRIVIYGPPGMGKTTLASEFPNPIFLQVEDGTPSDVSIASFGLLKTYGEVQDALASLYNEEHDFKTLVLDSADKFEPLLWDAVCVANKWDTIETPGYGKGYTSCDYQWREIMNALNALRVERGMMIVIICHSHVERFDDPATASYSQFDLRLHKRARAILSDEVDAILLVRQDVQVKQEEQGFNKSRARAEGVNRMIYTEARPAFIAKNRFGMPAKIKFDKGNGYEAIAPYLPNCSKIFETN